MTLEQAELFFIDQWQEIWYHEPEPQTDTQMTNTFGCQVKKTTNCVAETRQDCKYIKYQECQEVPVYTCKPAHVHKPTQELLHRKKCLLPDNPPGMTWSSDHHSTIVV